MRRRFLPHYIDPATLPAWVRRCNPGWPLCSSAWLRSGCDEMHAVLTASMEITQIDSAWLPKLLDLGQVEGAFVRAEGYSRPEWKIIREAIQKAVWADNL